MAGLERHSCGTFLRDCRIGVSEKHRFRSAIGLDNFLPVKSSIILTYALKLELPMYRIILKAQWYLTEFYKYFINIIFIYIYIYIYGISDDTYIFPSRKLNLVYLCYQLLHTESTPSFMLQTYQENNRFLPTKEGACILPSGI